MSVEEITSTKNSPSSAGFGPAWIEKGTVSNVDLKNYTVDVVSEYSSKTIPQVQIMHPYFHTHTGEGIFCMPEVGSLVQVCFPSDNDPPFVLGFISSFELEGAKTANLEDRAGEAANEDEEGGREMRKELGKASSGASTGSATKKPVAASARAGRPFLNPGDLMMQTRDRNFVILRRGGVIQIGATPTCQSVWIPVKNYLRHFAENIDWTTPGGLLSWVVKREEDDPGGNAPCLYRLALRDKAQNDKADVQIQVGHVNDSIRYKLEVAPTNVDVDSGEVESPKFSMTIDASGNQTFSIESKLSYDIKGGRQVDVAGGDKLTVSGGRQVDITGNESRHVRGSKTEKVTGSCLETYVGARTVDALTHTFGPSPVEPVVLGTQLVSWLAQHVALDHSSQKAAQVVGLNAILSKRMTVPA